MTLITYWHVTDPVTTPLKLFVHVLGPDGSIVAQEDRLDVPSDLWRRGDWIVQVNHVDIPDQATPLKVAVGMYQAETGARLPLQKDGQALGDSLLLREVGVP